ncbi:MAG: hypothetical protein WDM76_16735, partial [Limisphaerales bacterium]
GKYKLKNLSYEASEEESESRLERNISLIFEKMSMQPSCCFRSMAESRTWIDFLSNPNSFKR